MPSQLIGCENILANHYLRASTATKQSPPPDWSFRAGSPTILIETSLYDKCKYPPATKAVAEFQAEGVAVLHCWIEVRNRYVPVWILVSLKDYDSDFLRRIRLHLIRLHTERECLRSVLQLISEGRINPKQDNLISQLHWYLDESTKLLTTGKKHGIESPEILKVIEEINDLVSPGERDSLISHIERMRRTIVNRVQQLADRQFTGLVPLQVIGGGPISVGTLQIVNGGTVSTYNVKLGDYSAVLGNLTVAENIQNSFNEVVQSDAPVELKQSLDHLCKAVAEMSKQLTPVTGERVSRDLQMLTKESLSAEPRREWWQLSAKGLLEAAAAVGQMGAPVVESVNRIVALLMGQPAG